MNAMRWLSLMVLFFAAACSGGNNDEEPKAKEGEACAVDADCDDGLACRGEVCVPRAPDPDAGGDMDEGDVADNNETNNDNNDVPVEDEPYIISYILEDRDGNETLWIYDTDADEHTQVSPEGTTCRLGCWLSRDMSQFITARSNGANFDILAAPVEADLTVTETPMPIAVDVRRVEVHGDVVTYVREDAGENKAYYRPVSGGGEQLIGTIGAVNATEGDWHLDTENDRAVVYNTTLQTMDIKIGELGTPVEELAYTIDSSNYQETSGSYFGGNIPTAFSPDGKYMALVTEKAPMDYNLCENSSECLGPGQRCGRFGRCSAIEVVVHLIDLSRASGEQDHLGSGCSDDSTCGDVHVCDIPAEDAVDQAVCIPRRIVLGLPGDQTQQGKTGCELTDGNADYHYTKVRSPISFGPDGRLYFVAARDCDQDDLNIEQTDIVSVRPTSNDVSVVFGTEGKNFSADDCYDAVEEKIDVTNCTIWLQRALVSPGGNSVAFIGTNPNVLDPDLAQANVDLWTVKRNGEDHDWVGRHGELSVVKDIRIHPPL